MTRIISSLVLVVGLFFIFSLPQKAQLPANTCYFGVTGSGTGGPQSLICTDQAKFTVLVGQPCLPASGFVLEAQLPNGNCLPVQVFAPTGTVATNRQLTPGFVWWDQDKLSNKNCPTYSDYPGIPCVTVAKNIQSGIESSEIGVPANR